MREKKFSSRKFEGKCPQDPDLEGPILIQGISRVLSVPKLAYGFGFDRNTSQHHLCDLKGFEEQVCSRVGTEAEVGPNGSYERWANPLSPQHQASGISSKLLSEVHTV